MFFSVGRTGYQSLQHSAWPFEISLGVVGLASSIVMLLHGNMGIWVPMWYDEVSGMVIMFYFSIFILMHSIISWWMDMVFEGTFMGDYTSFERLNIRWGFKLFVLSEIFFFFFFFWAWFYSGIGEISVKFVGKWPPVGVKAIYPWRVPFLNLLLLVSSGMFSQASKWAVSCHSKELDTKKSGHYKFAALLSMMVSILLGLLFLWVQSEEYYWCSYTIADGVFGSSFYMLTGFHGMHVMVGLGFLLVCWFRLLWSHFSFRRSFLGLQNAIYYWHFVDVVWIFLFIFVYGWPHKLLTGVWLWTY
uniref:Cytochrome c oxidase subunit 3 n=1 Tax=Ruditapes philippinarum TaxID=129788 RepID=Q7YF37_RUDPH|nr:cytochrome c subunit III [Ruditapes philippinarum]